MSNAIESVNQKESIDAIYVSLKNDGHDVTKADIDRVLDKSRDLAINALVRGLDIKVRGLGTLAVRTHEARAYKLPNGKTGTAPAGVHVLFVESDSLLEAMNTDVA
ncbi:MAG: HU family DNA-binding protein [Sulfurospirillum sp.]|nr:HU family DNA-binding protein [Sulfurospirillum sp.]